MENLLYLPLPEPAADGALADAAVDAPATPSGDVARGAEIYLRVSYSTQLALHGMADHKARMLIQLNGVLLSLLLATESPWLAAGGLDPIATIPLLVTAVTSMSLALMAARPPRAALRSDERSGVVLNPIGRSDLGAPTGGAGAALDRLTALVQDPEATGRGMLSGLYRLGEMLESKHRMLGLAYLVFGIGMAITAAGFAVRLV